MNTKAYPAIRSLHVGENSTLEFNSMEEVVSSGGKFGFTIGETIMVKGTEGISYMTLKSTNEDGSGIEQPGLGWWIKSEVQGYSLKHFGRIENTIEDLKKNGRKYREGDVVELLGYYEAGDGAGHKRKICGSDDGSGIGLTGGLWANIVHNGEIDVSWFGARGDGVTDCGLSLEVGSKLCNKIIIPSGNYLFNQQFFIHSNTHIVGIGDVKVILKFVGSIKSDREHEIGYENNAFTIGDRANAFKEFTSVKNVVIDNIDFRIHKNLNIEFYNSFDKEWATQEHRNCIYFSSTPVDVVIKNCKFGGITMEGIYSGWAGYSNDTDIESFGYRYRIPDSVKLINNKFEYIVASACTIGGGVYAKFNEFKYCWAGLEQSIRKFSVLTFEKNEFLNVAHSITLIPLEALTDVGSSINISSNTFRLNTDDRITKEFLKPKTQIDIVDGTNVNVHNNFFEGGDIEVYQPTIIRLRKDSTFPNLKITKISIKNNCFDLKKHDDTKGFLSTVFSTSEFTYSYLRDNLELCIQDNAIENFEIDSLIHGQNNSYSDIITLQPNGILDLNNITFLSDFVIDLITNSDNVSVGIIDGGVFIPFACIKSKGKHNIELGKNNMLGILRKIVVRVRNDGNSAIDFRLSTSKMDFWDINTKYVGNIGVSDYTKENNFAKYMDSPFDYYNETNDTTYYWNMETWRATGIGVSKLDTPYMTSKMQSEGVYEDFVSYMDSKLDYDNRQRELEQQRQQAFAESGVESYGEWLATQPMTLPNGSEPIPSEKLTKFKKKYLG